jgi:hypothetical protein
MSLLEVTYNDYSHCCDYFKQGIEFLKSRSISSANKSFQLAFGSIDRNHSLHNTYLSYSGLAKILDGDSQGIDLCRQAVNLEFSNGDLFLNLARVEYFCENRKNAIFALQAGLEIDCQHSGLQLLQQKMGARQTKPISFLSRGHYLNQKIGRLFRKKNN